MTGHNSPQVPYESTAFPIGGVHEIALFQDGKQRAERGGGERDDHCKPIDTIKRELGPCPHCQDRYREREDPGNKSPFSLIIGKILRIDLVAGKQEQKPEP